MPPRAAVRTRGQSAPKAGVAEARIRPSDGGSISSASLHSQSIVLEGRHAGTTRNSSDNFHANAGTQPSNRGIWNTDSFRSIMLLRFAIEGQQAAASARKTGGSCPPLLTVVAAQPVCNGGENIEHGNFFGVATGGP